MSDERVPDDAAPLPGPAPARRGVPDDVAPGATPPDADPTVPVARALGLTPPSEVARAALARAKEAAAARGLRPGMAPRRRRAGGEADQTGRDPMLVGDTAGRLAAEHGWQDELSVAGVMARWADIAGPEVAARSTPESFADGRLVVRTDSTAWATELRRLAPDLLRRLDEEVGAGVVREVSVLGPVGPRWDRGTRRVSGRGPRDTYG